MSTLTDCIVACGGLKVPVPTYFTPTERAPLFNRLRTGGGQEGRGEEGHIVCQSTNIRSFAAFYLDGSLDRRKSLNPS